jgi:hypothetical protein
MRAFTSDDDERKYVENEDEDFVASFMYGEWYDRKMMDTRKMRELDIEEELIEIGGIMRQARKALRYQ